MRMVQRRRRLVLVERHEPTTRAVGGPLSHAGNTSSGKQRGASSLSTGSPAWNFSRRQRTRHRLDSHLLSAMLYPVLNLTSTQSGLYLTSGPHIHIFDPAVHAPLASTANAESLVPLEVGTSIHSGLVRLLAVSQTGQWLASVADDKLLKVWEVSDEGRKIRLASTRCVGCARRLRATSGQDRVALSSKVASGVLHLYPDADQHSLNSRLALKKISTLTFTSNDSIVLGDRLGDAFTYDTFCPSTDPEHCLILFDASALSLVCSFLSNT